MPNRRIAVITIKEVIRLKDLGKNNAQIKLATGLSRRSIINYLEKVKILNLSYEKVQDLSDQEIYDLLFPKQFNMKSSRSYPDWALVHHEMQKKNVTLTLLWEEYIQQAPEGISYSRFCRLYRHYLKKLNVSMRQNHKFGEKCFVDYAGHTIPIVNPNTGEVRCAQIFVAALGASNYTFANATWTQSAADWLDSHTKAFEYFGGVTETIVPDNLKSGVTKACKYEPEINRSYADFAAHYGVAIIPTRVRKPKDKAKVEVAVQIVERWILASLRNKTFFNLHELNLEISKLLTKLNSKKFKKLPGSRKEVFETHEKHLLKPLPLDKYELAEWKKARVNIDYHVELDSHYYSVPYQYLKSEVEICYSSKVITILKNNKVIARHQRSYQRAKHTTIEDHMPKNHQEYSHWSPDRIINWAKTIGPNTSLLIKKFMQIHSHPALTYRSSLGIINLHKKYHKSRIENAARRLLDTGIIRRPYQSMKSILEKGLDKEMTLFMPDLKISKHENIRGSEYFFQTKETINDSK